MGKFSHVSHEIPQTTTIISLRSVSSSRSLFANNIIIFIHWQHNNTPDNRHPIHLNTCQSITSPEGHTSRHNKIQTELRNPGPHFWRLLSPTVPSGYHTCRMSIVLLNFLHSRKLNRFLSGLLYILSVAVAIRFKNAPLTTRAPVTLLLRSVSWSNGEWWIFPEHNVCRWLTGADGCLSLPAPCYFSMAALMCSN